MTTATFHQFPELPTEIRLQIWRETLPFPDGIVSLYDWRWFALGLYDNFVMPVSNGRELRHQRNVQVPVPTALFINGESRALAMQWMAKQGLHWQSHWDMAGDAVSYSGTDFAVKVLARDWDVKRDYVYLGLERKHDFQEWTLDGLQRQIELYADAGFEFDADGRRAPFPTSWSTEKPLPPYQAIMQMKRLVVPASMGCHSTDFLAEILRYRQVEELYILWGELPQALYAETVGHEQNCELDVQPCWRLEYLTTTGQGGVDDKVEMHSYLPQGNDHELRAGDEAELLIEKGSLSAWMDELQEKVKAAVVAEDDSLRSETALSSFLKSFTITPVRLVKEGKFGEYPF